MEIGKIIENSKGIVMSDSIKDVAVELVEDLIGVLQKSPVESLKLFYDIKNANSKIRDGIFLECFLVFLLNSAEYDVKKQEFVNLKMDSFVKMLAESSPNYESGYQGNPELLNEYAKRIIKIIDDCGTIQKSYYIACLARAVRYKRIDVNKFFKLSHCVRNLTEEDLFFLSNNLTDKIISEDEEYIDDFKSLGLMKDVEGGFAYTGRAFDLRNYALNYEAHPLIPNSLPKRYMPSTSASIDEKEIDRLFSWEEF